MMKNRVNVMLFIALIALVAVVSAGMPASVQVITTKYGLHNDYVDANIVSGGNADLPNSPPIYLGWCVDTQGVIWDGVSPLETWIPYSTLDVIPNTVPPANWQAINYIINHKGSANVYQIQTAIWQLTSTGVGHHFGVPVSDPGVQSLLAAAASHPTWQPGQGDVYGVVLWQGGRIQAILIEVPIPPNVPEFPSIALPIAMILGTVFVIRVVKQREN